MASPSDKLRIAYITAGAAGMYCGSCMKDNSLVAALARQGHDALLVPTYTPIRTDEEDVSQKRVFFGGINVYLQQKLGLFRHTPWFLDRMLDVPGLLRWVSRFAMSTKAADLGDLTVSMLQGEHGKQRKEVAKIADWLAEEVKPQIINLTNALLSGMVHEMKRRLGVPVLCSLQGDDVYIESLPEPHKARVLELIREHCQEIDGFIATSGYYAEFMSEYFAIPQGKIHVVRPGINLHGHWDGKEEGGKGRPFTVGYFARICPEKGLHLLVEAFHRLKQLAGTEEVRLKVGGWLGDNNRAYFEELRKRLENGGLISSFEHVDCPDHASKVAFLRDLDVLSVPTTYREPKGLYILEALANGVPVVQPAHGSFPELVAMTGGGLLVEPNDPDDLAAVLHGLHGDRERLAKLSRQGREQVLAHFHADRMAEETAAVYRSYLR
jgi:glycosyltransferase involved in cell wall biosynthesis